jgi:hypothetical protein
MKRKKRRRKERCCSEKIDKIFVEIDRRTPTHSFLFFLPTFLCVYNYASQTPCQGFLLFQSAYSRLVSLYKCVDARRYNALKSEFFFFSFLFLVYSSSNFFFIFYFYQSILLDKNYSFISVISYLTIARTTKII